MGFRCISECEETECEVYLEGDDTPYTMHKAGFAGSVRTSEGEPVSFEVLVKIQMEDEAWCPIHRKVLKWVM